MKEFIDLEGASGATYRFRLWPEGAMHLRIAGNYVCVRSDERDTAVVSIGEAMDLSEVRGKLPKRVRETMTHVYTRLNVARAIRCAEHEDIMARHRGPKSRPAPEEKPAPPPA